MARASVFLLVVIVSGSTMLDAEATRPAFACGEGSPGSRLPFCRMELPSRARAQDLVSRLTVKEKVKLLVNNAAGVPRLGIGRYEWWSEALHGVSNTGPGVKFGGEFPGATSFPQVITSAASFNASLWELMGQVVSDEARAMYNGGQAGLTYWSPNVNIFRDPRWGRGQETPGEDPTVAGRYAAAYVRRLQQPHLGPSGHSRLKIAACCKHYTAYDLDNWKGVNRFHFNSKVSKQDLRETFSAPFETCVVEGKVASVMCSYNQVNGIPTCADPNLLRNTIRGDWKVDGYIVSDCDSVEVFFNKQHYTRTPEEASAAALKAGLDLDCGPFLAVHTVSALNRGIISQTEVDAALTNTIIVQMRLGMYDGEPSKQPFGNLGPADVCTRANQDLALEAARQGIVLLKNDGRTLPLSASVHRTVAIVGPNSNATVTMIGNYAGKPCSYTSPLQGIGNYVKTIHQVGCNNIACVKEQPISDAAQAAGQSDASIIVVGLDQSIEAEGRDRSGLLLPGRQQELVSEVAAASKGPAILVLICGGPVDISFAENDPKIAAIIWAGYPGQAGGQAIADVIFGTFNPGGKLPVTWYPQDYVDKVPMTDMAMRANPSRGYPGRTYRFYDGPVVYPFGFGLTYARFTHTIANAPTQLLVQLDRNRTGTSNSATPKPSVRVSHALCDDTAIPIRVDVRNIGERDGSQTVLVYSTPPAGHGGPHKQLVAFEKVHVAAGEQVQVELAVDVCKGLSYVDVYGIRRIPIGGHSLQIGDLTHSLQLTAL